MPTFKPFRGVRPVDDLVNLFPTTSLENVPGQEIEKIVLQDNTYANMIKPFLVSKSKDVDRNNRKIRNNFEEFLQEKKLIQDPSVYYLYEQKHPNKKVFRGLLGLVAIEDFWNGKIKRHGSTITQKKEKLAQYLDKANLQAEPVLLTYPSNSKVELMMTHEEKNVPIINYKSPDEIRHKVWAINNRLTMIQLKEVLESIDTFYIADGHHRIGSVSLNAKNQLDKTKKINNHDGFNYAYSLIVSNQSIKIHDYNRLIKDLNGLSPDEFLKALEISFNIHEKHDTPYYPSQKFHISMYLNGKFYSLHIKHELRSKEVDPVQIDHQFLDQLVFKDILKIEDTSSSNRIEYINGNSTIDGLLEIKNLVDNGEFAAGFGIFPISFNDMKHISDNKIVMPPKCTYIEPKLITGLIMYDMKRM